MIQFKMIQLRYFIMFIVFILLCTTSLNYKPIGISDKSRHVGVANIANLSSVSSNILRLPWTTNFQPILNILLSSTAYLEGRYYTHGIGPYLEISIIGALDEQQHYICIYTTKSGAVHYTKLSQSHFPVERMETNRLATCPVQLLSSEATWDEPVRVTIALNSSRSLAGVWANVISSRESPFPPIYDFKTYENISDGSIGICIPPIHGEIPKDFVDGFFSTVSCFF
jgi:hypothetical protein